MASLCGIISAGAQPVLGQLTGPHLEAAISGRVYEGPTRVGGKVRLTYGADHTVRGDPLDVPANQRILTDFGRWEILGDKFCTQMTMWVNGQKECGTFVLRPDGSYQRVLDSGIALPPVKRVN